MHSFPHGDARRPPPLRPYQLDAIRAIIASVRTNAGRSFVLEISRQGGKNETSARLEALLLTAAIDTGGAIVKTAPTLDPQLRTSYNRLADYLAADGIAHRTTWPTIHVGRASIDFRSSEPSANVVGATASLLLEVDEAQDVQPEIFDKRFRPMASTTNATTVYYGTAWGEADLLQRAIAENARAEQADGIRRNFVYDWLEVSKYNPAYRLFVESERDRLGEEHPIFQTEYRLIPLEGEGKLLSPAQLRQLQGAHTRLHGPIIAERYIAALDVAGEDTGTTRTNDRTVLTIGRLNQADDLQAIAGVVPIAVVEHIAWQGERHAVLLPAIADHLRRWRVGALTIDATGIGETTASLITAAVPGCKVEGFKFTQTSKSDLGFGLITAINTGALKLYADDHSPEYAACTAELARARRETRPNNTITFSVPESEGHDDYLISLALLAHTARHNPAKVARGRRHSRNP
jgi:hypothetical protein